jgi:hypothetical protein
MSRIYLRVLLLCALGFNEVVAQRQPATIPVAVAEAMSFGGLPFLRPQYFDRVPPTGWPAALVPSDATILGGGALDAGREIQMTTLVVSFPPGANGRESLRAMIMKDGFAEFRRSTEATFGGFETTPRGGNRSASFCKGDINVSFDSMDRTQGPNTFAVVKLEGEGGRQNCTTTPPRPMGPELPFTLPPLDPPKGTIYTPNGRSSSGESGSMRGAIRTTLQADSILFHYRGQLLKAGWRAEGRPGVADGLAVQRFTTREKDETWSVGFTVLSAGDYRYIELSYSRAPK